MKFLVITIADMVRAQAMLLDHLGIARLHAVIGGSMGGMQTLAWASAYPERVGAANSLASAARHSAQKIASPEVGGPAIMPDPDWLEGTLYAGVRPPTQGPPAAGLGAPSTKTTK